MMLVADACALISYLSGDTRLSGKARQLLADETLPMIVPGIAFYELEHGYRRGRHGVSGKLAAELVATRANTRVWPIADELLDYYPAGLEIHDGLYVATARLLAARHPDRQVFVVTCDSLISSSYAPVLW